MESTEGVVIKFMKGANNKAYGTNTQRIKNRASTVQKLKSHYFTGGVIIYWENITPLSHYLLENIDCEVIIY